MCISFLLRSLRMRVTIGIMAVVVNTQVRIPVEAYNRLHRVKMATGKSMNSLIVTAIVNECDRREKTGK